MQNGFPPLMRSFPGLRFDIRQAGSEALQRLVASGQVDIAIAYDPILLPGTRSLAMARQPLCAILPPSSALAGGGVLDLADVLDQPFAILNGSHAIHRLLGRAAADRGLILRPVVETDSIGLLLRYVTAGLGLTFLPRFSAAIQEARGDLVIREIDAPLLHMASAHVSVRARRRLPRSVNAVAGFLSDRMIAFRG
ncbi:LysR family transcriptional regulator substrate-binding protein, partial [Pseudogemmobacter sonorensis]|uniref:LysR family transcriptional regulator substrate-binding protein n=1 Tax=Pseudogemmobacter sonorensis TaxID=2989681 RepID=UPI0036BD27B8